MQSLPHFQKLIEKGLTELKLDGKPSELYDPIRYMLQLGGKRLRPALLLMSHELFGGKAENVVDLALGIEVFHNFTLLHDDIMDKAPLRRSQQTVHEKWNSDIAILSGDTMFVQACQLMAKAENSYLPEVLRVFFQTAIEVCEGQQLDMNFEKLSNVSHDDYIEMIGLKTAVLLGCSLSIGAITANANKTDVENIYSFGKKLGIAFQLHDDILDVYGDAQKFGKQVGGDIIANKKTFLLITAYENAKGATADQLKKLLAATTFDPKEKVSQVMNIYDSLSIRELAEKKMDDFFNEAMEHLDKLSASSDNKKILVDFAQNLMVRQS